MIDTNWESSLLLVLIKIPHAVFAGVEDAVPSVVQSAHREPRARLPMVIIRDSETPGSDGRRSAMFTPQAFMH
jgi:hypothetical protein